MLTSLPVFLASCRPRQRRDRTSAALLFLCERVLKICIGFPIVIGHDNVVEGLKMAESNG